MLATVRVTDTNGRAGVTCARYKYDAAADMVSVFIDGCATASQPGCEQKPVGCEFSLSSEAKTAIADQPVGLILGDAPSDINGANGAHIPGFRGAISKLTIHDALLSAGARILLVRHI
eukprot:COSAG05_NODE_57_length_23291_cov_75.862668_4_plen_118_part_00